MSMSELRRCESCGVRTTRPPLEDGSSWCASCDATAREHELFAVPMDAVNAAADEIVAILAEHADWHWDEFAGFKVVWCDCGAEIGNGTYDQATDLYRGHVAGVIAASFLKR